MNRIALGIEYDGTHYHGWQTQEEVPTIQNTLEAALTQVATLPINIICAGRTDAGVHAECQVIHFETEVSRSLRAWVWGSNRFLPPDIRVLWAKEVSSDFHARFSALARYYRYIIYNNPIQSALHVNRSAWCYRKLSETRMQEAAQYLVGEHDFTSFRGAACQAKSPIRRIEHFNVTRKNDFIFLEIKANAFLHHMVRNIAGTLIEIGSGKKSPQWIIELLANKDRRLAGMTANPAGLYLVGIDYPSAFHLTSHPALVNL